MKDYNYQVFDLTPEQKKIFNRLKKTYKDCIKAGIYMNNMYSSLQAYNSEYILEYGNNTTGFDESRTIAARDAHCPNTLTIPHEWCDDESEHRILLTKKGMDLLNKYDNE